MVKIVGDIAKSKRMVKTRVHPLVKKKKERKIISLICYLLIIPVLVFFAAYLSRQSEWFVKDVRVQGVEKIDPVQVKMAVEKDIEGSYLWLFPKKNIVIVPSHTIKANLESQFPRIKAITIAKEKYSLVVSVVERHESGYWCGDVIEVPEEEKLCFLFDETGFIFSEKEISYASTSEQTEFKEWYLSIGDNEAIGTTLELPFDLPSIFDFDRKLQEKGFTSKQFYFKSDGDIEVILSHGGIIRIKSSESLALFLLRLDALLSSKVYNEKKNLFPGFKYIDLRFSNQVPIKWE